MNAQEFRTLALSRYDAGLFQDVGSLRFTTRHTNWLEDAKDEIAAYFKDALVLEDKCVCGRDLLGLLGTFEWQIQHGVGACYECHAQYKLYHYFGDNQLIAPELIGFPKEQVPA